MVHTDETVRFDFVVVDPSQNLVPPLGIADYVAADIRGEHVEVEADSTGHFTFSHGFVGTAPEEQYVVEAHAYRQRGSRDYMKVQGEWIRTDSPYDQSDVRVFKDRIRLTVYKVVIDLPIRPGPDEYEPASGTLRIRRHDESTTTVYLDRPHRRGFRLVGPDEEGFIHVRYEPGGDELNPFGTTEVEFAIYDVAGNQHVVSETLQTP